MLTLFDRDLCEAWQAAGFAHTPLAIYHGVDFKMTKCARVPDEPYRTMLQEQRIGEAEMAEFERSRNNVISELRMELVVRK